MIRFILAAACGLVLASGSAFAAGCPVFPPTTIKYVPASGDVVRDTSKTAKELGGSGKPLPARYEHDLDVSASRQIAMQKQPDGSVCAGLANVDIKLGVKRKIYIAQELAQDPCVADNIADFEMPFARADEAVVAAFGPKVPETYKAEITAIGTNVGPSTEEAQKPLLQKMSAILNDKINTDFATQLAAATAKVDVSKWQEASCNGATDKAFAAAGLKPETLTTSNNRQPQVPQTQQPSGYSGGGRGGK